jgi:hypothetical protein
MAPLFDTYPDSLNLFEDGYCAEYLSQTWVAAIEGSKTRVHISSIIVGYCFSNVGCEEQVTEENYKSR